MTKRELRTGIILVAGLIILILSLWSSLPAYALPPFGSSFDSSGVYGEANFSRRDCFTRTNLVACWNFLTPGVEGDLFQNYGSFEEWNGVTPSCSACPTGFTCSCAGSSDVLQETSNIYDGNSSVRIVTDAATNNSQVYKTIDLEKNTAYQVTCMVKGSDAGDDGYLFVYDTINAEWYNKDTDAWQAGFARLALATNMGTSWKKITGYLLVDGVDRPSTQIGIARNGTSQIWYADNIKLQKLKSVAPVSDTAIALEIPVTSDPVFDQCDECQSFRGQPGDWGTTFDGTDDYLSRTDDDTFDPAGSFSVYIKAKPADLSALTVLASKWGPAGSKGWRIVQNIGRWYILHTHDGSTVVSVTSGAGTAVLNAYSRLLVSFDGDSFNASIYPDNNTTASGVLNGTTANVPSDFKIGAGSEIFDGDISEVCYWNKTLDAIDANKAINPYYPGNSNTRGFYVDTCSQTASYATCSWDNCRDGTANACQAEGTGVMAVFGQYTQIFDNNSFETNTNTQNDPDFTGFTIGTESAGDGTANISQYFGSAKHGSASARVKLTGTTSYAFFSTDCLAMNDSTAHHASIAARYINGKKPTNIRYYVLEYSDATCTLDLVSNSEVITNDMSPNWKVHTGLQFTSAATTNYFKMGVEVRDGNADVLVDTFDLKEAPYHTPWIPCASGSVTCTYNRRDYSLHNVLSDYIQAEDGYAYESGYCLGVWVYSDWDGDDSNVHRVLNIPGTAGNNNRRILTVPNVSFIIFDNAGDQVASNFVASSTNWSSENWHYMEACTDNNGTVEGRHYNVENDTWYTWNASVGSGTGIQTNQDNELEVGQGIGSNHFDGYFYRFTFGPYSSTWPMYGWGGGRVPKKPY